ncbi:MAG: hypothetical protein FJ096_16305 [Deltaproteobacteria bacterium]|nr:hypothetical protein [Deltaproteobacteria bacterium]
MASPIRTFLFATAMFAVAGPLSMAACGSDDTATVPSPTTTSSGGGDTNTGVCLLNSCTADDQCDGCPDGRTKCLENENRCVACDPTTNEGCKAGEKCSSFGLCVPESATCPTDGKGNPTISCEKNTDCKACDPQHQVCNTKTKKCQACTETNTQHCLASDICLDGECSPKCPKNCDTDNDCSQCGGPGNEAHACNNHKCAECSDTYKCNEAKGEKCVDGVCTPPCGIPGEVSGRCTVAEDCQYCGDPKAVKKWDCKFPVNDKTQGFCAPPANGCSDLGQNVLVLPPPFDQYTQTCSKDDDCEQAKAGIQLNVGKLIRDLVGSDTIDVGIKKVTIKDAFVTYDMPLCAEVQINENLSCGVCVPCKEDADCKPIKVQPLILDLFKGDAIATLAGVVLVQAIWGKGEEPALNFFCQQVVAGVGACIPCANPTAACGKSGGGGGSGMCDHDKCTEGGPLDSKCGTCEAAVCAADDYCCTTAWDKLCIQEADKQCKNVCSGGDVCSSHDECVPGIALDTKCSTCAKDVCAKDDYCCTKEWDAVCVNIAKSFAGCGCK